MMIVYTCDAVRRTDARVGVEKCTKETSREVWDLCVCACVRIGTECLIMIGLGGGLLYLILNVFKVVDKQHTPALAAREHQIQLPGRDVKL